MSVQSEINRITSAVSDAYTSVSEKGGTIPASQVVGNLATAIDSIPTGGNIIYSIKVSPFTTTIPTTVGSTYTDSHFFTGIDGNPKTEVTVNFFSNDEINSLRYVWYRKWYTDASLSEYNDLEDLYEFAAASEFSGWSTIVRTVNSDYGMSRIWDNSPSSSYWHYNFVFIAVITKNNQIMEHKIFNIGKPLLDADAESPYYFRVKSANWMCCSLVHSTSMSDIWDFTPTSTGTYKVNIELRRSSTSGTWQVYLYKNNVQVSESAATWDGTLGDIEYNISLNAGDTVKAKGRSSSTSTYLAGFGYVSRVNS